MTKKLVILGSTNGTDMQSIINSIENGTLDAKIELVISNKPNALILERAKKHNLKTLVIDSKGKVRLEFDLELFAAIKDIQLDLIVLIGYMRILSDEFVEGFEGRIINVHPSLLPKYAGGMDFDVHNQVIENKELETGCTVHLVTKVLDGGSILLQKKCLVQPSDTASKLKSKVQKLEGKALVEVIGKWS
jgi:phosphoribosylglycinamide formyltransferase 1